MDTKDFSPAYLTSLAILLIGALVVGAESVWLVLLGWILVIAGLALNVFATLVMVQRFKGGPLPELLAGRELESSQHEVSLQEQATSETRTAPAEPEEITESQEVVPASSGHASDAADERIFRSSRRVPHPHVR